MTPTERTAKSASTPKPVLYATLRGLLRVQGSGAPSRGTLALALLAIATTMVLTAAPALAAAPETPEVTVEVPVHATTATVKGVLNPNAIALAETGSYEFLYRQGGECEGGGKAPEPPGLAIGLEHEEVSEGLSGLAPNTQYTVCLREETAGGAALSAAVTFITAPAPPIVVSEATALPVKASEATLEAQVNPNNQRTTYFFEYSTDATGETLEGTITTLPGAGALSGFGPQTASVVVTGLTADTTYYYRMTAENQQSRKEGKPVRGKIEHFTTAIAVETPETSPASPIAATEATLNGVLNPAGKRESEPGSAEFFYRQSATECRGENEQALAPTQALQGHNKEAVSAPVAGLLPDTQYTFCLLARDDAGEEALGPPVTFTTSTESPAIAGESALSVLSTEAKLGAQIDPEGEAATYHVEYGTSEAYGQSTPEVIIPAAQAAMGVEVRLSELQAGITYYYRFVATNAAHETTRDTEGQTFTTAPAPPAPGSEHCPNEALRIGPSANLPDCRAYEQVTPVDKGRTQALTFTAGDEAIASGDGETLVLQTHVPFGPNPSELGARAAFSRTASGWEMGSALVPGANDTRPSMGLFSPDLSQVVLESTTGQNFGDQSLDVALEAGPMGGPYALVASIPRGEVEEFGTQFLGASADFGNLLFASVDHELPLSGPETIAAATTDGEARDLYDWSGGHLQLVNFKHDGSLVNRCGATLGAGGGHEAKHTTVHAVSEDGSKIFFTAPSGRRTVSGPGCEVPATLFMRANDGEPVEVSAPEKGVELSANLPVRSARYNYATPDGSKVFFNTETVLTKETVEEEEKEEMEEREKGHRRNKLFEYDTQALEGERLKLVASNVPTTYGVGLEFLQGFFFSEDGTVVYVEYGVGGEFQEIYRYETSTGKREFVALAYQQQGTHEPSYVTPAGEFFLFTSKSLLRPSEPRGAGPQNSGKGPNEMYRYDHADGSVLCVTCGPGDVPPQGDVIAAGFTTVIETNDATPAMEQMSKDGQEVFFQTTSQLVPQDTNSTLTEGASGQGTTGLDVHEWEAEGSEEAPGVFCANVNGCTHLLSSGEDVGPARLLGASANGSNVFLESAAQLVPQDTDEFPDIYDARVNGGFAAPAPPLRCLSCQGVGSPPPLFSVPASEAFTGAGNPKTHAGEQKQRPKPKARRCARGKRLRKGRCVRLARRKTAGKAGRGRGGR